MISAIDRQHLQRCLELAEEALLAGDEPFGSVLVAADSSVLAQDRNRIVTGDATRHPEFEMARWAAENMGPAERAEATVYTSGEHCPMCSGAHGCAGLGRIVYVSSADQLKQWHRALEDIEGSPIRTLPVEDIIPEALVEGSVPELTAQVKALHYRLHRGNP